jgi:hypothetical protein
MAEEIERKIMVTRDGPCLVYGGLPIDKQIIGIGREGEPEEWIQGKNVPAGETCALCRCENSALSKKYNSYYLAHAVLLFTHSAISLTFSFSSLQAILMDLL